MFCSWPRVTDSNPGQVAFHSLWKLRSQAQGKCCGQFSSTGLWICGCKDSSSLTTSPLIISIAMSSVFKLLCTRESKAAVLTLGTGRMFDVGKLCRGEALPLPVLFPIKGGLNVSIGWSLLFDLQWKLNSWFFVAAIPACTSWGSTGVLC